ncbi:hypothetical protein HY480_01695 [Candidatus Uhrbacteria bacterium]|nr:hypothetical protein [Candidatus Uhrbacteria bacterium]
MLEHLFGSKTRVKLLRIFLGNPAAPFYVRELARKAESQIHAVRRELENLERLGIICDGETPPDAQPLRARIRKYYVLDTGFSLATELRALVMKSQFLVEEEFKRRIKKLGTIRYLALLGMFVGITDAPTDVLVVGQVQRKRLARLMRQFEREIGHPVNYTVMSDREFRYRWDVGDRFLYGLIDGKKIAVIDELTPAARAAAQLADVPAHAA